jgi:protein TonB
VSEKFLKAAFKRGLFLCFNPPMGDAFGVLTSNFHLQEDTMFTSTLNSSWDERSRRGFTTLTSFGIQALVGGVLLLLPLLRPIGLPSLRPLSTPVSLGQPLGEPPAARAPAGASPVPRSDAVDLTLRTPTRIPNGIPTTSDDGPPQITGFGSSTHDYAGDPRGMPNLLSRGSQPVSPVAAPPARIAPLRISHMSEGDLVHKVLPTYPPLARMARIQGQVVLQAVISKQGAIEDLKVLGGHPMLLPAAIEAVRQWRYRPYFLNNEPVEVETQITVNFSLGGN